MDTNLYCIKCRMNICRPYSANCPIQKIRRKGGFKRIKQKVIRHPKSPRKVISGEPMICRICGKEKSASDFYWRPVRQVWRTECIECFKENVIKRRESACMKNV